MLLNDFLTTRQRQARSRQYILETFSNSQDRLSEWIWISCYYAKDLIIKIQSRIDVFENTKLSNPDWNPDYTKQALELYIKDILNFQTIINDPVFIQEIKAAKGSAGCIIPVIKHAAVLEWIKTWIKDDSKKSDTKTRINGENGVGFIGKLNCRDFEKCLENFARSKNYVLPPSVPFQSVFFNFNSNDNYYELIDTINRKKSNQPLFKYFSEAKQYDFTNRDMLYDTSFYKLSQKLFRKILDQKFCSGFSRTKSLNVNRNTDIEKKSPFFSTELNYRKTRLDVNINHNLFLGTFISDLINQNEKNPVQSYPQHPYFSMCFRISNRMSILKKKCLTNSNKMSTFQKNSRQN
jgi:hypothetical protein